jgi:hypothetical protein
MHEFMTTEPQMIKKEKIPDVILKVIIGRHGPKLSAEGEKNELASYFNEHVMDGFSKMPIDENEAGLVHVTSSSVKRAVDTANIYGSELEKTKHRVKAGAKNNHLSAPYQPLGEAKDDGYADDLDIIMQMQSSVKAEIKKQIEEEDFDFNLIEKEAELRNRIDMYVLTQLFNDENKEPEEKIFNKSYIDVADDFAKRILGFSKHIEFLENRRLKSEKQPKDESYMQIDVSHSFQIAAFLKKYLVFNDKTKAFEISPEEYFKRTGGIIRESGFLELDYIKTEAGKIVIEVNGEFEKGKPFHGNINSSQ